MIRLRLTDDTMSYDDAIYGPTSDNISTREGDPVLIKTGESLPQTATSGTLAVANMQ